VLQERAFYLPGRVYPIEIRLKIPDPWFIHSFKGNDSGIIPTSIRFTQSSGIDVRNLLFPEPVKRRFPYSKTPLELYRGEVIIRADLVLDSEVPPGFHLLEGVITYQACKADVCRPPESVPLRIRIQVRGEEEKAGDTPPTGGIRVPAGKIKSYGLWKVVITLAGFFLAGLGLNLTPCIYPLIPVTVSYFSIKAGKSKGYIFIHGLMYLLGIAITNSALGTGAALSGGMLGSALQTPWVLLGISMVLFLFGLSSLGLWEIRVPSKVLGFASKSYGGYGGSLFMGLTLGVIAAPCIGPFILGMLAYVGTVGDPVLGFIYFFVLSLGMGVPLMIIGIFSGLIDRIPFSGEWMVWMRKVMGWILILMSAHVLTPVLDIEGGSLPLVSFMGILAGIHLGWMDRSGDSISRFVVFKRLISIAFIIVFAYLLLNTFFMKQASVRWLAYDEDLIKKASEEGRAVVIDFYAEWCAPCIVLDRELFGDHEVVEAMKDILPLRVDLTRKVEDQQKILKRYHVRGVPTIIFLDSAGRELEDLRITSYVKKDIDEASIQYPEIYFNILKIVAGQTGSLLNPNSIGKTLQIQNKTVELYLYVMQKSFHIALVRPYYKSAVTELRKMKKAYFQDMGLRNFFTGNFDPVLLRDDRGGLLENYVFRLFADCYDIDWDIKYWRTQKKQEVDFIIREKQAYEVKFSDNLFKPYKYIFFKNKYPNIPLKLLTYDNVLEFNPGGEKSV